MIIELVGCPGAGKTTFVPTVVEACRRRGIIAHHVNDAARPFAAPDSAGPAPSRGADGWQRAAHLLGHLRRIPRLVRGALAAQNPRLVRHLWRTQRGRHPGADARERRVLHWYLRMMGSREFLRRHAYEHEAIVFDEGFVHRVVQLHASGVESPRTRLIAEYASLIPRADLVINVKTPPHICAERVSRRGVWSRLERRDASELTRFVDNAHRVVSVMVVEIRRRGWTIVDIDNGDDEPTCARRTLERELDDAVPLLGMSA